MIVYGWHCKNYKLTQADQGKTETYKVADLVTKYYSTS